MNKILYNSLFIFLGIGTNLHAQDEGQNPSPAQDTVRERSIREESSERYWYYQGDNPMRDPRFDRQGEYYQSREIRGDNPVYVLPERNAFPEDSNRYYDHMHGY